MSANVKTNPTRWPVGVTVAHLPLRHECHHGTGEKSELCLNCLELGLKRTFWCTRSYENHQGNTIKSSRILYTFMEAQLQEQEPKDASCFKWINWETMDWKFNSKCKTSWIGLEEKIRHCWHCSSYWAAKYTICIKCRKVKFRITTVLIKPKVMCKLYTVGKIIKLAFQ